MYEEDLALARSLLDGDARQFDAFFADYFGRLYRFALRRLNTDEEATKDVVQTMLMNAVRSLGRYRGEAALFTWLCQICSNEIAAHYRRLKRSVPVVAADDDAIRPILESIEAASEDDPDRVLQAGQTGQLVHEALDHLPANYASALEWKYVEGHSVAEIARRLEITELAAQSLLARARVALRETLLRLSPRLMERGD
jgi:RNA polymerase sigma-70 factor, ECF subfamily